MPMRGPRATSVGWLVLLILVVALFALSGASQGALAAPSVAHVAPPLPAMARAPLSVPLALPGAQPDGGAVPTSQFLGLSFAIQDPTNSVNALLDAQQTPGSGVYHEYVTPQQFSTLVAPPTALVSALQDYFQGYGFQVTYDPSGIYHLFGTAGEADSAFDTTLVYYASGSGSQRYWAPNVAPTLPSQYASALGSVVGLNTESSPTFLPTTPSIAAPLAVQPAAPARPAALTVTFSGSPFYDLYQGTTPIFVPPVGQNVSVTATVTGGTPTPVCPCTWTWSFGDGTSAVNITSNYTSFTMHHEYRQAFNQFSPVAYLNVTIVDSTLAAYGSFQAQLIPSMSAQWMSRFYGALQMDDHGKAGAGMTIGLNEMCDPNITNATSAIYTADVNAFSTVMGLPNANIVYVGPGYPECATNWGFSGWSEETLLDMEWAHAMAPNATLEVYFGIDGSMMPWENYADLDGGDSYWANNLGSDVWLASNSWGLAESTGYYSLFHNTWAQAAAEGLSLFASAGDCGDANGALLATGATNITPSVNFPADDPDGIGVGGTIMQTTPNGTFVNEYVWNGTYSNTTCENNEGTGGGWSCVFTQPGFQYVMPAQDPGWDFAGTTWGCGVPNYLPRGVPDVSADAATWADTYEGTTWLPVGGTSLASPMWTAMMAVTLSALGDTSRPVGLLDNQLYAIGDHNVTYHRDFHDITSGDNCNTVASCTSPFSATPMWDAASGWGSPNLWNLTYDLNGTFPTYYDVSGQVLNGATLAPIVGATVFSGSATTVSGANGDYSLYFPPGSHTLDATATGFAQGSTGVLVNSTDLTGVNILLWSNVGKSNSTEVVGKLVSQTQAEIDYGLVDAYRYCSNPPTPPGPCPGALPNGSSGSYPTGNFTLFLQPGLYFLIGSAPGYNDSRPIEVVVGALPVIDIIVQLNFSFQLVEGQVLSTHGHVPVWGASVQGTSYGYGTYITATAKTSAAGQFFLHLPAGTASFTASQYGYTADSLEATIFPNGVGGILLLLVPSGTTSSSVSLSIRTLDTDRTSSGLPILAAENSTEFEVWANNSITGAPQLGIYLQFVDSVDGDWQGMDNVTVGGSYGAPSSWADGQAFINYTAPFVGIATLDQVNVQVLTPGWSGSGSMQMYITPYYPSCPGGVCTFQVEGVVVATNGAHLAGAQVQIYIPGVTTPYTTTVSGATGYYFVDLQNGSYLALPSLPGYQKAALTAFSVNGAPEEVDLSLAPVPPALTPAESTAYAANHNLFSVDTWAIVPFLALAMAMIAVAAFRFLMPGKDEEDKTPVYGQTPAQPEQQIFPGGEGAAQLPAGQDAGAAAPGAPPAETPWEITPAPPPPPPDTGPSPGLDDDTGAGGDASNPPPDTPPDDLADSLFPPPAEPPSGP